MACVLVIDDDPMMRAMIRETLEEAGHGVVEAPDGEKGIQLYRQRPADVVVTDIFMLEKEGLETIQELKRNFPGVKIIALSGGGVRENFDFLAMAKEFGALYAFQKPFPIKEFLKAVAELSGQDG
jgi:DNA-binding response OmpR family regulator